MKLFSGRQDIIIDNILVAFMRDEQIKYQHNIY